MPGHEIDGNTIYTCPMHPEVVKDLPGLCPECGMNLIPKKIKEHQHGSQDMGNDFDKHAGHSTNIFKRKFWVSLILSIPVVLYSSIAQNLLRWNAPVFPGSGYVALVLSSFIFFYGGWIFLSSAVRELKARLPGMMTLIALAITVAYAYSLYTVFAGTGMDLFWELSTLITIMLLGHWLEMRAVSGAQGALKELSKLLPDTAEVIRGGKTQIVPLAEIAQGDVVLVRPGEKIPSDGQVVEGSSEVNESLATGESKPVLKSAGSQVIAGTINGDGSLTVQVTKIGDQTFLAGVMRLVAEAQASKSRMQMLSDRAAFYLTIIAVVTGAITFAAWLAAHAGAGFAVERLVAVLVITCPHALGLAIPLVASISTTKAAQNGFLVKSRIALEAARKTDIVLFDKTGTLTKGEYGVDSVFPEQGIEASDVLALAAAVNSHSEHPIAKALLAESEKREIKLPDAKDFRRIPGKGVEANINGRKVMAGSSILLDDFKIKAGGQGQSGRTVIFVIADGKLAGSIALGDVIRAESREALAQLKAMGIKTAMITGDSEEVAKWVSDELAIDEHFSRVLPEDKANKVKLLQQRGLTVAMVGDGINDAPALTQADLGIAIGAGTNVAIESAGIILVKNDPRDIVKIIRLSKMTYSKMIQNLFWATGYNVVAIPLAAGVLSSKGILLQPAVSAVFMSLSTVIVAVNAMLLKGKKLD